MKKDNSGGLRAKLTPQAITIWWTFVGSLGLSIWTSSVIISTTAKAGDYWVEAVSQFDPFRGVSGIMPIFGGILGIWGALLSFMNVGIMWLDVAHKTVKLNPNDTKMYYRTKRGLFYFQFVAFILAAGTFGFEKLAEDGTSIYGLIFPFIVLVLVVWFGLASLKLSRVIKSSASVSRDPKFRAIIWNIQFTCACVITLLFLYGTCIALYSYFDTLAGSWKRYSAVGEFQFAKAAHHGQFIFPSLLVLVIHFYLVRNFRSFYSSRWGVVWRTRSKAGSQKKRSKKSKDTGDTSKFSFDSPYAKIDPSRGQEFEKGESDGSGPISNPLFAGSPDGEAGI